MSSAIDISKYIAPLSPFAEWGHVAYQQNEGVAVNLTTWSARGALRRMTTDVLVASFTSAAEITLGADGLVSVTLPKEVTALVDRVTDLLIDVDLIDPSGTVIPLYYANVVVLRKASKVP